MTLPNEQRFAHFLHTTSIYDVNLTAAMVEFLRKIRSEFNVAAEIVLVICKLLLNLKIINSTIHNSSRTLWT